jgi:dTDP-4-dehydrorhamnose reductase
MPKRKLKILVIGNTGQICRSLRELNDQRIVFAGRPEIDLGDRASIKHTITALRPDLLINPAAYTQVNQAEKDADVARKINTSGARHLARITAKLGIPVIHFSTDYVFDGTKKSPYNEDDPCNPATVYGRTKLAGEQAVRDNNPKHIILRTSWVFSPFRENFVKTMVNLARKNDIIQVVNNEFGSPTYAPDLSRTAVKIALKVTDPENRNNFWGTYHATGSGVTNWADFAREIFRQSGILGGPWAKVKNIPASEYPTLASRPKYSVLDTSKLTRLLGSSQPPWKVGVEQCVSRILQEKHQE